MGIVLDIIILFIMNIYKLISRSRIIYTDASEEIIGPVRLHYLMRLFHFFPSVIVSIIITVKTLPNYFSTVNDHVQNNSGVVWLYALGSFIITGLINGFIIEKILALTNLKYKRLKTFRKNN